MEKSEVAYIELIDCRENKKAEVTAGKIKNILRGKTDDHKALQNERLKVQFNPNSLKFTARGNSKPKVKKGIVQVKTRKGAGCVLPTEPANMDLQIQLIFDRSIYLDDSVQPEVEGFLALIKNPMTRQIRFNWGEQHYKGQVNTISAEYSMFNSEGVPIRANVNFTLELSMPLSCIGADKKYVQK